jgi:hypothetical protein
MPTQALILHRQLRLLAAWNSQPESSAACMQERRRIVRDIERGLQQLPAVPPRMPHALATGELERDTSGRFADEWRAWFEVPVAAAHA